MAKQPNPQLRIIDGCAVVNRDWMVERTGASHGTVSLWYAKRNEVPAVETDADGNPKPVARHPEKSVTIERVDFYDKDAFEAFYADLQERKRKKVLPTSPELYDGEVEDRISINQAAEWFHFAGPGVIRKYVRANPGYFPAPVGTVEGPTGRQIPAFRRGDLQDFDRKRTGDNTGAAGRPAGPQPRGRSTHVTQRIETALAYLREIGGYRRGAGAELAARHNEPTWKWERAIKEARNLLQSDPDHQAEGR